MIRLDEMNNAHRNRSKYIDTVAVLENIIRFVEGSKLYETYEILDTDYHGYVIDVILNAYFEEDFSNWDNINKSILDPEKHTYREKFRQLIEKNLDAMNIKKDLDRTY